MQVKATSIPDVKLIVPKLFGDHRGFFMETYRDSWFRKEVADVNFVQDNHSKSAQGVLRGLHYQIKQPQGKLVRVTAGEVFDVAVDMRSNSPTFGQWVGEYLTSENNHQLWVPPGFAHGFYVLSETAEFVYKCTDYYAPEYERSLLWNDETVNIPWPIIKNVETQLSPKDINGLTLKDCETF